MNYTLKRPCGNCPFLREGGIRLRAGRVREIVHAITDRRGGEFACHKTVTAPDEGDEDDHAAQAHREAMHCAGALIYAHKHEAYPQMVRIEMRLTGYDPDKLEGADEVFDDLDEMLATAVDAGRRARR